MDFEQVWQVKDWSDEEALTVALEAVQRGGREVALIEWAEPSVPGGDFLAFAEDAALSDREAVAMILAFAEATGYVRQMDAHARRVARRNAPDPDHYGS